MVWLYWDGNLKRKNNRLHYFKIRIQCIDTAVAVKWCYCSENLCNDYRDFPMLNNSISEPETNLPQVEIDKRSDTKEHSVNVSKGVGNKTTKTPKMTPTTTDNAAMTGSYGSIVLAVVTLIVSFIIY